MTTIHLAAPSTPTDEAKMTMATATINRVTPPAVVTSRRARGRARGLGTILGCLPLGLGSHFAAAFTRQSGMRPRVGGGARRGPFGGAVDPPAVPGGEAAAMASSTGSSSAAVVPSGEGYSTLALVEHVHLLTPDLHEGAFSEGTAVDFLVGRLGFGLDVESVSNVRNGSGVAFADCGACQLHLNDDPAHCERFAALRRSYDEGGLLRTPFEIGLRYEDLSALKERLRKLSAEDEYEGGFGADGREFLWVEDRFGNMFVAREAPRADGPREERASISSLCQQRTVPRGSSDHPADVVERYGVEGGTECLGMDYIEFFVPVPDGEADGAVASKIARFYETFFDAPAGVVNDGVGYIAVIGAGRIGEDGRAEQSLLFREVEVAEGVEAVPCNEELGTGHHLSIYVGSCEEDFEAAASNVAEGGLLWANPMFEDVVLDVEAAMNEKQFRFKDVVDVETGEVLYTLEHEVRSVTHPLFPGRRG